MLLDELPGRTFQKWAERRFNWTAEMGCRQSVASFALLMSQDEQIAFDLFFDLRKQAVADIADFKSDGTDDFELPQEELVSFITNGRFKDRPGMWLGGASVDALWALCSGFVWRSGMAGSMIQRRSAFSPDFRIGSRSGIRFRGDGPGTRPSIFWRCIYRSAHGNRVLR
jgi:hypothetical protein